MSGSKEECDAHRALLSLVKAVDVDLKFIRQQYDLLVAENKRLKVRIDRLTKTADGAPVVEGMTVWYVTLSGQTEQMEISRYETSVDGYEVDLYSTREAAEAAFFAE